MNKFNLKYLIIGVIGLSVLIVAGAYIYSQFLTKKEAPLTTPPNQTIDVSKSINQPGGVLPGEEDEPGPPNPPLPSQP